MISLKLNGLKPKIVLVILSIALSLLILELALRFYYFLGENMLFNLKPSHTTLTWQEDPIIGPVILTPNISGWMITPSREYFTLVETNSQGFYDIEHNINKSNNTYRILLLGDSFVASLQTQKNETIGRLLESNLNQDTGKKFEVISIGLGDTGTAQQYLALKNIGLVYKPDLVIHLFLTANDLKNNWPSLQKDPYRPYFKLNNSGELEEIPHVLKSQNKFFKIKEFIKNFKLVDLLLQIRQNLNERTNNHSLDYPIDYHVYDKNYTKDYKNSWEVTKKIIQESQNIATRSGAKYILAVAANNEQVNFNTWLEIQKTYPKLKMADLDLHQPDKLIGDFCKSEKLDCLFMLPDFEEFIKNNPNTTTHFKYDGHWNNSGTNIAVKSLSEFLISNYFSIK